MPPDPEPLPKEEEIRQRRMATLMGAYDLMKNRYVEVKKFTFLHDGLAAKTVEHYLREREALKQKFKITSRIQRHKIAGLMASAIMLNRPVQLTQDSDTHVSYDNECLAIFNGVSICAEGHTDRIAAILKNATWPKWFNDLRIHLNDDPANAGGFMMTFETLLMDHFPESLNHAK